MQEIARHEQWKLTTVLKLGCTAADVNPGQGLDDDQECLAWRSRAIAQIVRMQPTLIILGSATNKLNRPENPDAYASATLAEGVREGVLRALRPLSASGARMALLRDTPEVPFDVTSCLARAERHSWYPSDACDLPVARVLDPRIFAAEQSAAASLPGIWLIDLTAALCPQGICKAVVDGKVIYRDTHHLAGKSAASVESLLSSQVTAALR
jgi:hypothetical protein